MPRAAVERPGFLTLLAIDTAVRIRDWCPTISRTGAETGDREACPRSRVPDGEPASSAGPTGSRRSWRQAVEIEVNSSIRPRWRPTREPPAGVPPRSSSGGLRGRHVARAARGEREPGGVEVSRSTRSEARRPCPRPRRWRGSRRRRGRPRVAGDGTRIRRTTIRRAYGQHLLGIDSDDVEVDARVVATSDRRRGRARRSGHRPDRGGDRCGRGPDDPASSRRSLDGRSDRECRRTSVPRRCR